jgi:cysteine desulfurase / selenocysteine lyase
VKPSDREPGIPASSEAGAERPGAQHRERTSRQLDVARLKADFPILERTVNGKRLVYLDSASSSQKPQAVLDAMDEHYRNYYANIHRGVYTIAEESTAAYELARGKVARFLGAGSANEVVFTKNITEAINLFAHSWGRTNLRQGDPIVVTEMEHHANVVPWHILAAERGIELRWLPIDDDYRLDLTELDRLLDGAKLFAFTAMSNVLGTVNDVRALADAGHAAGATVLVDAAQAVPHGSVDVRTWGADFVGFTGHKMLGPSGIGGFWARPELLEEMPPFLGGGEMILDVRKDGYVPNEVPWKFEAGTMPIAEASGLAAAVDYLEALGMAAVHEHERQLTHYALQALDDRFGDRIHIHGPRRTDMRGGIVSFGFDGIHAHDISQVLDEDAVCVRASHHCAKPLMRVLGVPANTRASFYVYNDEADIDALVESLVKAEKFFAV